MKALIALVFASLVASNSAAETVKVPFAGPKNEDKVFAALVANGFAPVAISCMRLLPGLNCYVELPGSETRDPSSIIQAQAYVAPIERDLNAFQANRLAMVALAKEIRNDPDPVTAADVKALTLKLKALVLRIVFDSASE